MNLILECFHCKFLIWSTVRRLNTVLAGKIFFSFQVKCPLDIITYFIKLRRPKLAVHIKVRKNKNK